LLNIVLEVTGERTKDKGAKVATARRQWVPTINNHGGFKPWAFLEITDPFDDLPEMIHALAPAELLVVSEAR
jgi:type III restriction enzyme